MINTVKKYQTYILYILEKLKDKGVVIDSNDLDTIDNLEKVASVLGEIDEVKEIHKQYWKDRICYSQKV